MHLASPCNPSHPHSPIAGPGKHEHVPAADQEPGGAGPEPRNVEEEGQLPVRAGLQPPHLWQ